MVLLQPSQTRIGTGEDIYIKQGAVEMTGSLTMNNRAINLGVDGVKSQIYYDSGNLDTVIVYPDGEQLVIVEEPSGVAATISASGMACSSFVSRISNNIPVVIQSDQLPTLITTLPVTGVIESIASVRLMIVNILDPIGLSATHYVDFGGYWIAPDYAAWSISGYSSDFPAGWTIQVPVGAAIGTPVNITLIQTTGVPVTVVTAFVRFG